MSDNETYWKCPNCGYRVTSTQLQSAIANFQCSGTFGTKPPKLVRCNYSISDYERVQDNLVSVDDVQDSAVTNLNNTTSER